MIYIGKDDNGTNTGGVKDVELLNGEIQTTIGIYNYN